MHPMVLGDRAKGCGERVELVAVDEVETDAGEEVAALDVIVLMGLLDIGAAVEQCACNGRDNAGSVGT